MCERAQERAIDFVSSHLTPRQHRRCRHPNEGRALQPSPPGSLVGFADVSCLMEFVYAGESPFEMENCAYRLRVNLRGDNSALHMQTLRRIYCGRL